MESELKTVEDYQAELQKILADVPDNIEGTYEDMYFVVYGNYRRLIRQIQQVANGKYVSIFNADE